MSIAWLFFAIIIWASVCIIVGVLMENMVSGVALYILGALALVFGWWHTPE